MNEAVDGASIDREAERTAEKERKAEAAVERIHKGAHWLDWMDIAEGLETGQVEAIRSVRQQWAVRPGLRQSVWQMAIDPPMGEERRQRHSL